MKGDLRNRRSGCDPYVDPTGQSKGWKMLRFRGEYRHAHETCSSMSQICILCAFRCQSSHAIPRIPPVCADHLSDANSIYLYSYLATFIPISSLFRRFQENIHCRRTGLRASGNFHLFIPCCQPIIRFLLFLRGRKLRGCQSRRNKAFGFLHYL
jgi:hypothetical protein